MFHDAASIAAMRETCALAAELLDAAGSMLEPGMCTEDIDAAVHASLISNSAYPSPLMYGRNPFPKSICISVNEVALHGIPDDAPLCEGDVVSLDLVAYRNGFHGDTCRTYIVGDSARTRPEDGEDILGASARGEQGSASGMPYGRREGNADPWRSRRLVRATKKALHDAIRVAGPGVSLATIGEAVQNVVDEYGFDTVKEFKGHGVGRDLHTKPLINHYRNSDRYELKPGLTFTIEPMLVENSAQLVLWKDGWTASTKDGGLAAQFEHTLLVTDHGVEVLT